MSGLIQAPDLDIRDEEQFAAEMIGRVSGGLDVPRINSQIEERRRLLDLLPSLPSVPICPELTNANPSSPHTVLLETLGWSMAQMARRINQLPVRDQIAFANLFIVGPRAAIAATTTLRFTSDGQHDATIPAGTQVSTRESGDGSEAPVTFATDVDLFIPANPDQLTGDVAATCTIAGPELLAPGTLTNLSNPIAFVVSVTNPDAVDSGAEAETVDQALTRARNFQRRGLRLVSAQDVEDFVFEEVMQSVGIVKVFPFIQAGNFDVPKAGCTSIVVMTPNGNPVTGEVKTSITAGLAEAIGNQFFFLLDPIYVTFSVSANIRVESIAPEDAIKAAVEKNLRDFYAPKKGNFGRPILRAEVISIIEGTPGVVRIVSTPDGPIVGSPGADVILPPYKLPKLNLVTLTVVP